MTLPNSASARDVEYHLHPVTDARKLEETGPIIIERGEGIYVVDSDGNRMIEGLSGLWNTALGFGEPRLVEAAARQMGAKPVELRWGHRHGHGRCVLRHAQPCSGSCSTQERTLGRCPRTRRGRVPVPTVEHRPHDLVRRRGWLTISEQARRRALPARFLGIASQRVADCLTGGGAGAARYIESAQMLLGGR